MLLAGMALVLAGIWAVPPLLDWNRFRHAIATIVGAELGRGIVINGDVALRLLPAPVLTATDVTLPDQGDGTSAHIASLRLEVALGPLLRGRLAVRDLVLGSPVVSLPWPLPASMIRPERPSVPHAFAAHVENGTLRTGQAEVTGINAAIHGGPEASLGQDGPVTNFGAEGFAAFDGQRWRFTAALGTPDADNVSAVDLAVQGQGAARETGGAVVGTLSGGVLQGRLQASGPDLSLIIPASPLAWRAEAPFVASSERVESAALSLLLGKSPATATFALHLSAPARLDAALHAASLDLDGWTRLLRGHVAGFAPPVPIKLAFDADGAALLGSRIGALGGMLSYDGRDWALDQVQAKLPGNAHVAFSGKVSRVNGAALAVQGPVSLDAPDLRATLDWLRPLAPDLAQSLPRHGLRQAGLLFTARVMPDLAALSGISGTLDGSGVDGEAEIRLGPHASAAVNMHFARLDLDDWLGAARPRLGTALADAAAPFAAHRVRVQVSADTATALGATWSQLAVSASTGPAGLRVDNAVGKAGAVSVRFSGALGPDGAVTGARLRATAPDIRAVRAVFGEGMAHWAEVLASLPGPVSLRGFADGPPNALTLQLHAETADLTLEADSRRDTLGGTADTTLTLRHPGASFLLDALGARQTDRWIGLGPLAVLAHVHGARGRMRIEDVALSAADLRLSGQGDIALDGDVPALDLDLVSPLLTLPSWGMLAAPHVDLPAFLSSWRGEIRLKAGHIEAGLAPVDGNFTATLTGEARNGVLLVEGGGGGAGIVLSAAADASRQPALAAMRAEVIATPADQSAGVPLRLTGGRLRLGLDLSASGDTVPALLGKLSGDADLTLRNTDIGGLDLPLLTRLLASGAASARGAVQAALTSGVSDNVSGALEARFDRGRLSIGQNGFSSIDGNFRLSGTADFSNASIDVSNAVQPALAESTPMQVHYTGTPGAAKATADLGAGTDAPARPEKPRKPRPAK
jgi:hypothetical protein